MINKKISILDLGPIIKEQIEGKKIVYLTVSGNSMKPFFIDQKTIVTLEKITKPLKKKDIVFYQNYNGQFILHRIISIKKNCIIIRGDALTKKEYLDYTNMIAIVTSYKNVNKEIKTSSFWYKRRVGLWLFIKPLVSVFFKIYGKFMFYKRKDKKMSKK